MLACNPTSEQAYFSKFVQITVMMTPLLTLMLNWLSSCKVLLKSQV